MRPFEGIRVIDITHVLAGPFAAYQLGVLGADVIKVEHPRGDRRADERRRRVEDFHWRQFRQRADQLSANCQSRL